MIGRAALDGDGRLVDRWIRPFALAPRLLLCKVDGSLQSHNHICAM